MLFTFLLASCSPYSKIDVVLDCEDYIAGLEVYNDLTEVLCTDTHLHLSTTTGLPDQDPDELDNQMMIGIEAWIQRVPIPYGFEWKIPMEPLWLIDYQETTGVGPVAVAVNGVPIFHYEKRPLESIDPDDYDAGSDTVVSNELDQCGGHAGQGEDYHYHYAPICLLENHDLSDPIAFSLDGIPIYYGTGGDDILGQGRFSDWNNLPGGSTADLDSCNAYQLEDESYVYYTTATPPYVLGCHRAEFDLSLQNNVPFQGRPQGSSVPYGTEAGEAISTSINHFYVDDNDMRHLEFQSGSSTAEWSYSQTDITNDCWEFTFKENVNDSSGIVESYCR